MATKYMIERGINIPVKLYIKHLRHLGHSRKRAIFLARGFWFDRNNRKGKQWWKK